MRNLIKLNYCVTILFTRESSPAYCRIFYISIISERFDLKSYHKIFLSADDRTQRTLGFSHIQGAPGGMDKTSGECFLC